MAIRRTSLLLTAATVAIAVAHTDATAQGIDPNSPLGKAYMAYENAKSHQREADNSGMDADRQAAVLAYAQAAEMFRRAMAGQIPAEFAQQVKYIYAECLFFGERWKDAAEAYDAARDMQPPPSFRWDAALGAIVSRQHLYDQLKQESGSTTSPEVVTVAEAYAVAADKLAKITPPQPGDEGQKEEAQFQATYLLEQSGKVDDSFPVNPNGSLENMAGVCNSEGNVLAVMPHPERASWLRQVPEDLAGPWGARRKKAAGDASKMETEGPGRIFFESLKSWKGGGE